MTLSSAFNIATTSFAAIGTQTSIISSNIANANTPGYSTQIAHLAALDLGGVVVDSVSRATSLALAHQVNSATSLAAMQNAISSGVSTLAQSISDSSTATAGAQSNGNSPYAMLSAFSSAISTYESDPSSIGAAQGAVTAAKAAASSINTAANAVQQVRSQADQGIAAAVKSVNSLLSQFQTINDSIVKGTGAGRQRQYIAGYAR